MRKSKELIGNVTGGIKDAWKNSKISLTNASIEAGNGSYTLSKVTALPAGFNQYTAIQRLLISNSEIDTFSLPLTLTKLTALYLYVNQIKNFSISTKLTSLADLHLEQNDISSISTISSLINLTRLVIIRNELCELEIGKLIKLRELHLNFNSIETISGSVAHLTDLKSLSLRANELTTLPIGLGKLTNLTSIDIRSNKISILPYTIYKNMKSIFERGGTVSIGYNPFQCPEKEKPVSDKTEITGEDALIGDKKNELIQKGKMPSLKEITARKIIKEGIFSTPNTKPENIVLQNRNLGHSS